MEFLTIDILKSQLNRAFTNLKAREDEFSNLDAVIGDGDHGTAIVTAFTFLVNNAEKGTELKTMLADMGMGVMLEVSGSTSTLLGAFFLGMSDGVSAEKLDANGVKAMFAGGLANVKQQTKAVPGDKTMMDVLVPAVEAINNCNTEDIKELFAAGAAAANAGAESTIQMKANFGRARNYGEKSIGTMDSGAASWSCMFSAFAEDL